MSQSRPSIDLTFARAVPVAIRRTPHTSLHLIGCSQIGSWLAPSVARIARALQERQRERRFDIVFSGTGFVEEADIDSENFCLQDLGKNTADVLASRYGRAWGLDIASTSNAYASIAGGYSLNSSGTVVLTCGDPTPYWPALLSSLSERYYTGDGFITPAHWWIGTGRSGQRSRIVCGSTQDRDVLAQAFKMKTLCTALPLPTDDFYADPHRQSVVTPLERIRSMLIDQSLAAEAADYLLRLLTWQLKKNATYFEGGEARSNIILPDAVSTTPPEASAVPVLGIGQSTRPPTGSLHLVLVGCGGTGGWLVPALARLGHALYVSGRETQITLIDHDIVEPGNILRQNFCEAEIGLSKAQTLVNRLSPVFRRSMSAVAEPFKAEMIREFSGDTLILIGCVDNAAARQELSRALKLTSQPVWWIDSGNHAESGQVRIGSTASPHRLRQPFDADGFCIALPAPGLQSPDLLVPWAEMNNPVSASCEQMALWNTQSLVVNQRAAAIVAQYVTALVCGSLKTYATHFDLPTGAIRSQPITPSVLKGSC